MERTSLTKWAQEALAGARKAKQDFEEAKTLRAANKADEAFNQACRILFYIVNADMQQGI